MDRFGTDLGIPVMDERGVATFKPVGRRRAEILEPMVPKPESGWNGRHAVCPATAEPAMSGSLIFRYGSAPLAVESDSVAQVPVTNGI